jgi:hypothetical protein
MSILAADRKAVAGLPNTAAPDMAVHAEDSSIVHDYKKITLHLSKSLALGIAGNTQDHYYIPEIKLSVSIDELLWKIRKHLEGFLRFHDRAGLNTLTSFMVNQGIASFFDQNADTYFTNTFLFSPIESQTRLYRGREEVQILHAGSGSEHFKTVVGLEDIDAFRASIMNSCTPEACIPWMQDAYRRIGANDSSSGAEAVFMVSTRSDPKFHAIEYPTAVPPYIVGVPVIG